MRKDTLQDLPLGTSSFEALREAGEIYVDKFHFSACIQKKKTVFNPAKEIWKVSVNLYIGVFI